MGLISGERLHLLFTRLWRLHGRGGVTRDQTVVGSLFECLAERAVDMQHAAGREAAVEAGR
jgi:hypothetical protein